MGRRPLVAGLVALLVLAGCADDSEPAATTAAPTTTVAFGPDEGDGVLRLATTYLDTPTDDAQAAAVQLAVDDVNAAGGVLGQDVVLDALTSPDVDAVIGVDRTSGRLPAQLTEAGIVWVASSGPTVEADLDGRLAFRTGPPSALVAQATADLVVEDGAQHVALVALTASDDLSVLNDAFRTAGLEVSETTDDTDAAVLVGQRDAAPVLERLIADGYSPADHGIYLLGDDEDTTVGDRLDDRSGVLEGVKVLRAGAEVTGDLRDRLPDTGDLTGAAEAYDAVVIATLAAEAAQTDDPDRLGAEIIGVTRGGSTCTSFDECRLLVDHGDDVDFAGFGGTYALGPDGRPTESVVAVLEYGADNRIDPNRTEYRVALGS